MILERLKYVKAIFLDVDGVLTDGSIFVNEAGEQLRTFNVKDGYAIQLAIKKEILICIITGGKSEGVLRRFEGLGVREIHMGISDKLGVMDAILKKYQIKAEEVLFIGDDIPDLACMQSVGIAVAPQDAVEEIKAISHYISSREGGRGVVRDVVEKVMKLQNKWNTDFSVKSV